MRKTLLACTLVAAAVPASAEIFRCVAPGGAVSYQEIPCEAGAHASVVPIPTSFPDYIAARDRLAAREAAADARLLKRLELETAERIARDERLAREAELAAERERAAADSGWAPVYVAAPGPLRPFARRLHARPGVPRHSLHLMR